MAYYQPPTPLNQGKFNPAGYEDQTGALTIAEANSLFLRFPTAQGTENFGDVVVAGTLSVGTFSATDIVITGELTTNNPSTFGTTYGYQTSEPAVGTSIHNTSYGFQCAKTLSTTTGSGGNSAFGAIAMPSITGIANLNTAMGHNSLWSLTTGLRNTAVGAGTQTSTITTGVDNTAIGFNAKAIGDASFSVEVGSGATATTSGTAVGYNSISSGNNGSCAFGLNATSSSSNTTSLGANSDATVAGATAVGYSSQAIGANATSVGFASSASGSASVAIGDTATASGTDAIAIGDATLASGLTSVALGSAARATASGAVAIGEATQVSGSSSVGIGVGVILTTSNTIQLGTASETVRLRTLAPITNTGDLTIGSGSTGNITFNINDTNPLRIGTTTPMINFQSGWWSLAPTISTSYQAMAFTQFSSITGNSKNYSRFPINFIPRFYTVKIENTGTFTGTGVQVRFNVYRNSGTPGSNSLAVSAYETITSSDTDLSGEFVSPISADGNNDGIYVAIQFTYTTLTALNRTFYVSFFGQQTP